MTITRKLYNDNGLHDWETEHQAVTGGIFYCRSSAGFSVSASNKLSCNLTVKCSEIGNKNIPPNRYHQGEEKDSINENDRVNGLRMNNKMTMKEKNLVFLPTRKREKWKAHSHLAHCLLTDTQKAFTFAKELNQ